VHAVVALKLRVARTVWSVVPLCWLLYTSKNSGWLNKVKKKRSLAALGFAVLGRELTWAAHVRTTIGPEALRPIVEAASLGAVDQLRDWVPSAPSLLIKINGYPGYIRCPAGMDEQTGSSNGRVEA